MKYGVVFPQTEFGNDIQAIKDYAQTVEGRHSVLAWNAYRLMMGMSAHPGWTTC